MIVYRNPKNRDYYNINELGWLSIGKIRDDYNLSI